MRVVADLILFDAQPWMDIRDRTER